jgi:N-acetylmuramic acid 6-phosphate etherase
MNFTKTTEQSSKYEHLEKMSVQELLANINQEDKTVPDAVVEQALPQIETLVNQIVAKMKLGGRLFYIGAGTWTIRNRTRQNVLPLLVFLRLSKRNYCWW